MKSYTFLFILIFVFVFISISNAQNYLSTLSATKDDPLFTTYAAPLSRSEFIVDEGYQFKFFQADNGINFETDKAGYLSLAFKLNNDVRYYLNQMRAEPVITTSYSDLVKYHYQPYEGIDVDIFFQVYSSRIAIQEFMITNNTDSTIELDVFPFLQRPDGLIEVNISPTNRYFSFYHAEHPDGWTVGHGVPYEDFLANVFVLNEPANSYGSYTEIGTLNQQPPLQKHSGENYCVEWGRVYHTDGSLCYHLQPNAQQIILRNSSIQEILTEDAPKWGDLDPNIPGNGYQSCELGNFQHPRIAVGDSFTVIFTCIATGEQGIARGVIQQLPAPEGVRNDIQLIDDGYPPIPQNVRVSFSLNFISAVIIWDQLPGYLYSVFRRCGSTPGRYDLIADSLNSTGYLDLGLDPDSSYFYIVIARDSAGRFSGHSQERGRFTTRPFFSDIYNQRLYNSISSDVAKVVAFQKSFSMAAAETKSLRIIRGVTERDGDLDSLYLTCENLMTYNMEQAIIEDEIIYSRIPHLEFSDPDYEMMYWGAFSMMRQCLLPPEGECSSNYYLFSREPTWGWGHGGQVFHESLAMLAYAYMDPVSAQQSQFVYADRMNSRPYWPAGYIPYRVGPYLNEVNYWAEEYSSSAPWFSWENWEIFKISKDTTFLRQMYNYGIAFYNFWINERDDDGDGLGEWGGHAFWESVRDYNVIWDLLGGWANPHNANKVEALDLNCELVMTEKSLANMATALGKEQEALLWFQRAQARTDSINALMWDPETHFYYHVDKTTHVFTYQTANDLKRREIIGFLPLWAGIATEEQAEYLVQEIQNSSTFGRPYGAPLLAHNDPYDGYDTHSVYPEWDFLVFKGLLNYGFIQQARQLADRIFSGVIQTLKDYHDFYESYYCDAPRPSDSWLHTYIWTGVIARMLIDLHEFNIGLKPTNKIMIPKLYELEQNYPNPFNSQTRIQFKLPTRRRVSLRIFNIQGNEIKTLIDDDLPAGIHHVIWDGTDENGIQVGSGLYFYRIEMPDFLKVKKMTFIK